MPLLALLPAAAALVRGLHQLRLVHNSLYPKHLFAAADGSRAALIDLEKMRWSVWRDRAMWRDLDTLNRHSAGWSRTDRLRFLLAYLDRSAVDRRTRRVWLRLAGRHARKLGS